MDGHSWLGLVLLLGALVLLVFVAAAEAGVSLNQARLHFTTGKSVPRVQPGHASPQVDAYRERETLLGSLALAHSLAVVAASALAFFVISRVTGSTWAAVGIAVAGSLAVLALLEVAVRSLVHRNPERWVVRLTPLIRAFRLVFGLPALALVRSGHAVLRSRPVEGHREAAAEDDESLLDLMEMEEANGGIEEEERAMIRGIIKLVGTATREIMVPRIDIVAVDTDTTMQEVINIIRERGFSRIPLYEGTIDNVVGVLYAKDFLRYSSPWLSPARPQGHRPPALLRP